MKLWIRDPDNGKPSVTLSLLIYGLALASFKLLTSDLNLFGVKFPPFAGGEFAVVLVAVAGLYGWRKGQKRKTDRVNSFEVPK